MLSSIMSTVDRLAMVFVVLLGATPMAAVALSAAIH